MDFNAEVVMFNIDDIPIIANLDNGRIIGLTREGYEKCEKVLRGEESIAFLLKSDKRLHAALERGGFFVGTDGSPRPSSAYVHVTQRCNLNCIGCYSRDATRNKKADPTLEDLFGAIDKLAKAGVEKLIISGGEPFLREDLPELLGYAKRRLGIRTIEILSNGLCLTVGCLDRLRGIADKISISFDGPSPDSAPQIRGEQRFNSLVDAIRLIQKHGIESHIIATLHARNICEMDSYQELALRLGTTMHFSLFTCPQEECDRPELLFSRSDLETLAHTMLNKAQNESMLDSVSSSIGGTLQAKSTCGAGCKTLSVSAEGTVYPCHMLHRNGLEMGNIFQEQIEEILASDVAKALRSVSVSDICDCRDCESKWLCGGGCKARAFYLKKSFTDKDPYCPMFKNYYEGYGRKLSKTTCRKEVR